MTDRELFARHPDLVEAFERNFYGPETNLEKLRAFWKIASAYEREIFKAEILQAPGTLET